MLAVASARRQTDRLRKFAHLLIQVSFRLKKSHLKLARVDLFPCRGWPCHGGSTPRPGSVEHPPGPSFPDVAGGLRRGQRYRGAPVGRRQQGEEAMRGYEGVLYTR